MAVRSVLSMLHHIRSTFQKAIVLELCVGVYREIPTCRAFFTQGFFTIRSVPWLSYFDPAASYINLAFRAAFRANGCKRAA